MFTHILVPLDGSALAECVIPHVISLAAALDARVSILHVLERPNQPGSPPINNPARTAIHLDRDYATPPVDPVKWHLKKHDAVIYLDQIAARFQTAGLKVEKNLLEGPAAECIINFANNNQVDLIILSTHGASGLSMWNVSSVVQKIILRANKSTLLVRAYETESAPQDLRKTELPQEIRYSRLFIGLDCSARAELVLPVAIRLAERTKANLIIGTVVQNPEIVNRLPVSKEDSEMIARISERNQLAAAHYLYQVQAQLANPSDHPGQPSESAGQASSGGSAWMGAVHTDARIGVKTKLVVSDSQIAALHTMVEEEKADMVMLVAHGHSGEPGGAFRGRWPYGSVATSFIAYGTTSLLIVQDLSEIDRPASSPENPISEIQGR